MRHFVSSSVFFQNSPVIVLLLYVWSQPPSDTSLRNTSVAVSLFLGGVRKAFCAIMGELPFGIDFSLELLTCSSFPFLSQMSPFQGDGSFLLPAPHHLALFLAAATVIHFLCQSSSLEHKLCEGGEILPAQLLLESPALYVIID